MRLYVLITHDTDGNQVGASIHTSKKIAESALIVDISNTFIRTLNREDEYMIEHAWSDSGFSMGGIFHMKGTKTYNTLTWYLREVSIPFGELSYAYMGGDTE